MEIADQRESVTGSGHTLGTLSKPLSAPVFAKRRGRGAAEKQELQDMDRSGLNALNHDQPASYPDGDRLGAALRAKLCQDLTHVKLSGMVRDLQLRCDRLVRQAVGEHPQNLQLAGRQGLNPLCAEWPVDMRRHVDESLGVSGGEGREPAYGRA